MDRIEKADAIIRSLPNVFVVTWPYVNALVWLALVLLCGTIAVFIAFRFLAELLTDFAPLFRWLARLPSSVRTSWDRSRTKTLSVGAFVALTVCILAWSVID